MSEPPEEWRDVLGWEGWYQVSSRGRLRSVPRQIIRSNGVPQTFKGKLMAPAPSHGGYLGCVLRMQGYYKRLYIHQMMLEAFVCARPTGMEGRHIDGNNRNNTLSNLEWGTKLENERDKLRHGTDQKSVVGDICMRGHLLRTPNLHIIKDRKRGGQGHCRACSNAHSYIRYHKIPKTELRSVADRYYRRIMSEVTAT